MSVIRAKRSQQTSASLKKTYFLYVFDTFSQFFHLSMPKSEALPSFFAQWLCFKELWERFALVALYKRVTMSDSLRLLMTKEWREQFTLFHKRINLLLFRSQKRVIHSKKTMSIFQTLHSGHEENYHWFRKSDQAVLLVAVCLKYNFVKVHFISAP